MTVADWNEIPDFRMRIHIPIKGVARPEQGYDH